MTTPASAGEGVFTRLRRTFGLKSYDTKSNSYPNGYLYAQRAYMVSPGQPVWMERDYQRFAEEAYMRNVVAHRCVQMIAQGAASIPLQLKRIRKRGGTQEQVSHPLLALLANPNPAQSKATLLESVYHYRLISGNAFLLAVGPKDTAPKEIHVLRPDRMAIIAGRHSMPSAYRYTVGENVSNYPVDKINGISRVLHLKHFHPLSDWYGLSPIEAAAYSIDQHNQSSAWNQALMQNGARPSGALVVKGESGQGNLSDDQYYRLKNQIDEQFSGTQNAGRPMLLEGGLDWKEMSLSPKDMDFIEAKNAAARDIALAFGVPPQLLGIPGDNTYSNLQEARLALWEQTILPLAEGTMDAMSIWLSHFYEESLKLKLDTSSIPALALRTHAIWNRVQNADFLSDEEKRKAVGMERE